MPVVSKSQARFMRIIASGKVKKKGLSKKKAQEFLRATKSFKNLPERKSKQKKRRRLKLLRKKTNHVKRKKRSFL